MATIREIITTEVAPPLLGSGGRTLSDIFDALMTPDTTAATRHAELMALLAANHTALMALLTSNNAGILSRLDISNQRQTEIGANTGNMLGEVQRVVEVSNEKLDAVAAAIVSGLNNADTGAPFLQETFSGSGTSVADLVASFETGTNTKLDAIAAAIGAAPFNDLELGSIRGFLHNIQISNGKISAALGDSTPPEPYHDVRTYLSMLLDDVNGVRSDLGDVNQHLDNANSELQNVNGSILSGNSLITDLNINISGSFGEGSTIIGRLDALTGAVGAAEASAGVNTTSIVDTIISTSGSIRGEFVTVVDAISGGASATVAEIITSRDQTLAAIDAQTTDIETALGTAQAGIEGALGTAQAQAAADMALLQTLLNTHFAADAVRQQQHYETLLNICFAVGGCDS